MIWHSSPAFQHLMKATTPTVDRLSTIIPAVWRIPSNLAGHGDWGLAAQHILLIGWITSPVIALWVFVDVLIINRSVWSLIHPVRRRHELIKQVVIVIFVFVLVFSVIFFGLTPRPIHLFAYIAPLFLASLFLFLVLTCFLFARVIGLLLAASGINHRM